MILNIRLQSFRSYSDESFEFSPSVNIIVGPNASGKTNLLEAILVLSSGFSYRVKDADLIKQNKDWSRLDVDVPNGTRSLKLQNLGNGSVKKTFIIDGEEMRRVPQDKKLPTVLFEPNHLLLFHLGPDVRRDYIDELIGQTNTNYEKMRVQYRRTLAQRNRLLKNNPTDIKKQIFVWNVRLSELAGHIIEQRHLLVNKINAELPKLYKQLTDSKTDVSVNYISQLPDQDYSSKLLHKLEANLEKDRLRGFTTYGPHRDDMEIKIGGNTMQEFASRGEARTVLLALKIVELQLQEKYYNKKPQLLLDDVFSELDGVRRQALTKAIEGYQTFITTTDADIVVQHFLDRCTIIPIDGR